MIHREEGRVIVSENADNAAPGSAADGRAGGPARPARYRPGTTARRIAVAALVAATIAAGAATAPDRAAHGIVPPVTAYR